MRDFLAVLPVAINKKKPSEMSTITLFSVQLIVLDNIANAHEFPLVRTYVGGGGVSKFKTPL